MPELEGPKTVAALNGLDHGDFVAALGAVFEHSPWIAERTYARRPLATIEDLHGAMCAAVRDASPEERLALLMAHPELAGKVARAGEMTESSVSEQSSAGLDRLTDAEFERFNRLNAAYATKFGFPFIIAVRHHDKTGILDEFERRLGNAIETEFDTALAEVFKISRLRLEAMFADPAKHGRSGE